MDDKFLIETSFKNARGDGEYQNKFNNKFFYHLISVGSINEIKKDKLIPVTRDIFNKKHDLLDKEKIKKLGGE